MAPRTLSTHEAAGSSATAPIAAADAPAGQSASRPGVEKEDGFRLERGRIEARVFVKSDEQEDVRQASGEILAELANGECVVLGLGPRPFRHAVGTRVTLWLASRLLSIAGVLAAGYAGYRWFQDMSRSPSVAIGTAGVAAILVLLAAWADLRSDARRPYPDEAPTDGDEDRDGSIHERYPGGRLA